MKTIYKYPIKITDIQPLKTYVGAKLLFADLDPNGQPCIWAEVDTDEEEDNLFEIRVVGTGNPMMKSPASYLNSFKQGVFVWHVYSV